MSKTVQRLCATDAHRDFGRSGGGRRIDEFQRAPLKRKRRAETVWTGTHLPPQAMVRGCPITD